MSTFYDTATIRRLAEHDPFYRGAAWILDQQAAAATIPDKWCEGEPLFSQEEVAARRRYRERKAAQANEGDWDNDWSPAPRTAA